MAGPRLKSLDDAQQPSRLESAPQHEFRATVPTDCGESVLTQFSRLESWIEGTNRRPRMWLAIFAALMAVQISPWLYPTVDGCLYMKTAREFIAAPSLADFRCLVPPGYPALITPAFLLSSRPVSRDRRPAVGPVGRDDRRSLCLGPPPVSRRCRAVDGRRDGQHQPVDLLSPAHQRDRHARAVDVDGQSDAPAPR